MSTYKPTIFDSWPGFPRLAEFITPLLAAAGKDPSITVSITQDQLQFRVWINDKWAMTFDVYQQTIDVRELDGFLVSEVDVPYETMAAHLDAHKFHHVPADWLEGDHELLAPVIVLKAKPAKEGDNDDWEVFDDHIFHYYPLVKSTLHGHQQHMVALGDGKPVAMWIFEFAAAGLVCKKMIAPGSLEFGGTYNAGLFLAYLLRRI